MNCAACSRVGRDWNIGRYGSDYNCFIKRSSGGIVCKCFAVPIFAVKREGINSVGKSRRNCHTGACGGRIGINRAIAHNLAIGVFKQCGYVCIARVGKSVKRRMAECQCFGKIAGIKRGASACKTCTRCKVVAVLKRYFPLVSGIIGGRGKGLPFLCSFFLAPLLLLTFIGNGVILKFEKSNTGGLFLKCVAFYYLLSYELGDCFIEPTTLLYPTKVRKARGILHKSVFSPDCTKKGADNCGS